MIFDATSDGIFLHDLETRRLTMGNKSCLQMLGYTQEEFLNLGISDLHLETDLPFIDAQIEEFLRGGQPIRHDVRFKRKDGSIFFADVSPDLVQLQGKRYVVVALKDITERKRLEEELQRYAEHLEELVAARTGELQESEARYRSLYHTIADGIFVMGADGRIADVNDSACAQLGYTRAELMGTPVAAISARPDFQVEEIFDRLRTAGSLSYETAHRRKDGATVPVELSVTLVEYRGRPAVLGVARDITERQRAEEALQFTQFAIDHTADAAFWMTEDGRLFYVNEAACQALGYSCAELRQMTVYDIDPAFTESMWLESWRELKAKKNLVLQTVHRARDGRVYPVEIRANYVEFGGRAYDCAFARDITERQRAEQTLRESEERHRRLIENLKGSHFIYRHDTKGVFQYVSESLTDVLGYAPQEFLAHYGKYLTDHPANQAAHRHTELTLQGIPQPPYEVNIWHKDGSRRWLEVQEVPVFDTEGRVVAVEGVAQDITGRKWAEEALRQEEHLLSESQRIGHIGTWSVDLVADAATWTPETYRLFGVSPETFMPSADTMIDLLHPKDRSAMREWIRAVLAGEHPDVLEFRVVLPDGSVRTLSGRGELIFADDNQPVRLVGTAQDVTEQKQAQEALCRMNEQLEVQVAQRTEDLRRTVGRLRQLTLELSQTEDRERQRIADLLHDDVQQMLAAARFHLNLLGSEPRSAAESRELVEQIKQMLKEAIEKARNLSHELSPVLYQVGLTEILNWLAGHMQRKHGLTVRVEAHGPVDSSSEPLKALLYKVAQELLFNVVKHAGVSEATIRLRRLGPCLYLSVVDRGRGFDPQEVKGALGFGLLGIQERVQLLGGRMKIRSVRGMGSRFLILVPDEEPSPAVAPAERRDG